MTCKPLNFKDNSLIIICQNDYLLWDIFWSTCALYVPLLTLAWHPVGAEVYVFSSTLRQQVFGICELVAWHDPDVVHQDVASKSFVVDTTAFTPQQSSFKSQFEKIIYINRNPTLLIICTIDLIWYNLTLLTIINNKFQAFDIELLFDVSSALKWFKARTILSFISFTYKFITKNDV